MKKNKFKRSIALLTLTSIILLYSFSLVSIAQNEHSHKIHCKRIYCDLCVHINYFQNILKNFNKADTIINIKVFAVYIIVLSTLKKILLTKKTPITLNVRMNN